jgi:hypothetical protein
LTPQGVAKVSGEDRTMQRFEVLAVVAAALPSAVADTAQRVASN